MGKKVSTMVTIILSLVVVKFLASMGMAQEVPTLTKEEVRGMLGHPDVIIIDVRASGDWESSKLKIKSAIRENPRRVSSWIDKYSKDKNLVFYCA